MANKRIPELVNIPVPAAVDKLALYDSQGDLTGHVNVSDLVPGSEESININWSAIVVYVIDNIVKSENKFWASLQNGNLGNVPIEAAFWTEVSSSHSGLVLYQPGVFLTDEVYVINTIPNRNGFWLLRLKNATRPFNSTDFTTEYNNGDWEIIGDSAPNPTTLVDAAAIAFDMKKKFFDYKRLNTAELAITLTLSNVIEGANQILSVKKTIAGDVTITLEGGGLTFYGYNDADLNSTPEIVLSGASGDVFDVSFLARTATEIGVIVGENGN